MCTLDKTADGFVHLSRVAGGGFRRCDVLDVPIGGFLDIPKSMQGTDAMKSLGTSRKVLSVCLNNQKVLVIEADLLRYGSLPEGRLEFWP
jgi:hypothetical protein